MIGPIIYAPGELYVNNLCFNYCEHMDTYNYTANYLINILNNTTNIINNIRGDVYVFKVDENKRLFRLAWMR